jgi:hypothetical protein
MTSVGRLLRRKSVKNLTFSSDGEAIKLKPEKSCQANRAGKRVCADEDIAAPRLIWTLFLDGCAGIPSSTKPTGTFLSLSDIRNSASSPSPAQKTARKTAIASCFVEQKTVPWPVNTQNHDRLQENQGLR